MNISYALAMGAMMIAVTALTSVLAQRFHFSQSILLVIVGAGLAFTPGVPAVNLHPDAVLLLLLPPLLYTSGVGMSWRGFRNNLRPIMLLAIGCVILTASVVAAMAHWLLGMSWALGFVLGAVVSPPDAVAPMAIARRLAVPRKILLILEGEGLVNDATALILFSFAVAAVTTGSFSLLDAARNFLIILAGEVAWGVAVGAVSLRIRAWSRNTEVEMVLALLAPFAAFWPPHYLGGSGVLASVVAGLYVSWNGPRYIAPATRLQGYFVWGLVGFIIEGLVFLLTGLQAKKVFSGPDAGDWDRMFLAIGLTVAVVIAVRFAWVYAATYLPRALSRNIRESESNPGWRGPFLISFTGIRGGVSLVAALSVPEMLADQEFPERDLILLVTFCVILVSLVGQGLALPWVITALGLDRAGRDEALREKRQEIVARIDGIDGAIARLDVLKEDGAPSNAVSILYRYERDRRDDFVKTADTTVRGAPAAETAALQLQLVDAERAVISKKYLSGELSDEARRRIERELDLEEARLHHAEASASGGEPVEIGDVIRDPVN